MPLYRRVKKEYGAVSLGYTPRRRATPFARRYNQLNRRYQAAPRLTGSLYQQVRSLSRAVGQLQPELKYFDITVSASNISSSGSVTHITAIGQGDTQSSRDGNSIKVKSLAIRGAITVAGDIPTSGNLRYAIVIDKQQVADTSPTAAAVFTEGIFGTNPITALPNLDNLERFKVVYLSQIFDLRRMGLLSSIAVGQQPSNVEYNWTGTMQVSYNGANTSDIAKNGIYFVILSDVAGSVIDFSGMARVAFIDE